MGCTQPTASIIPHNHIPIERLYVNDDYSMVQAPPVVVITAPPPPNYVKSALKKSYFDERGRPETLSHFKPRPVIFNKSVNFDEQVLVKARTPTPNKSWYEKASSTMPMRKYPRNDNDQYDYDDEDIPSVSSDDEQENNEQLSTLGTSNSSRQRRDSLNNLWYKSDNMNTYPTDNQIASSINRIKVRRKLPQLGPPLISHVSTQQFPSKNLTVPSYQTFHLKQPLQNTNIISNGQQPILTNNDLSSQTPYNTYNQHPIENVT